MGQTCQGANELNEKYEVMMEFEASRLTLSKVDIIDYE